MVSGSNGTSIVTAAYTSSIALSTVATVTAWLAAHPEIELISRDRASDYATAAKEGAPQAVQVCDRWHLLRNLSEQVYTCLARMRAQIRVASQALAPPGEEDADPPGDS